MSDVGGGSANYEINVDASGLDSLEGAIAGPIERGTKKAVKSVAGLDNAVAAAGRGLNAAGQKLGKNLSQGIATGLKANSAVVQAAIIHQQTQAARGAQQASAQSARAQLAAQTSAARLQIAQTQAVAKQQAVAAQTSGQLAIAAARTSGQQRIAITRFTLDSIARLEKGLGRVIEGTASTIVSATRRIFAGTVGSLQRSFAERRSVITRNLNIEKGLFAQSAAVQQRASRGLLGAGLGAAGILGGGALAIGAIRQVFTLGSDFARGLNVLQAQLALTDTQMKSVSDQAIQLGNDITLPGVSALDAAQAIGLLAKQFAALGDAALPAAQAATKGTLQLARATGASAEDAAQIVGSAVNVFGIGADKAVQAADSVASALSNAAGTSVTEFAQAFAQGAGVFSLFQKSAVGGKGALDEFNAALAVLARAGRTGSDAGTSLKQFFIQGTRQAAEATTATTELINRIGETGTIFNRADGAARPLVETIGILQRGVEGLTDAQRQSTLAILFGSDAISTANALIDTGAAGYQKLIDAQQKQGFAAQLAAAQNKGLAGALDAIKSQFQTFGILIFQKVNKPLGQAGLAIATFINNLANAGGVFAAVRAGLKGVGIALGALVAIKGLGEIIGFGRALLGLFGPLGITAIVLGAAFGFLAKRFGSFSELLAASGRLIARIAPQVATLRKVVFDFLSNLAARATVLGRFSGFLQQIFNLLGQGKAAQAFDRLKTAAGALLQNLKPIGDAFKLLIIPLRNLLQGNFAEAFKGLKHVGSEIASALATSINAGLKAVNPFVGIGLDFINKFKAQFVGAGIGAVAGGFLGGPLGVVIGAGIGVAVTNGILKLKESIGRIDVGALFGKFLDGVRVVGQKLAQILFDKKTLLAVAGVAGAAAAIAVQFVQGFVSGLLSKLGDIRAAGAVIIKAIFDLPAAAKAIAAFVLLIRGLLTSQFKQVRFDDVLGQQLSQGVQRSVQNATLGQTLKAAFTSFGKVAGQALTVGISAALSGSALGSASTNLEKGLGIAGIVGSAGAAFASLGGGPQGAIAAAATVGVGLLTAALTANARKAAEAKAAMQDYKRAMDDAAASGKSVADAISGIFGSNFKNASDTQLKALKEIGVNLADFQKALDSGKGADFLKPFEDRLKTLQAALQSGVFPKGVSGPDAQREISTLVTGLGFLEKQVSAVGSATDRLELEKSFRSGSTAADRFEQRVHGVDASASSLAKSMEAAKKKSEELFRAARAEKLKAELDAVKQRAQDIGAKADEANRKLINLLSPKKQPSTPQEAQDTAAIATPGFASDIAAGIEQGVGTALGGATVRQGLADFGNQVAAPLFASALKEGIKAGDPAGALNTALQAETIAINQLEVPQEAKDALIGQLNAQFASASNPAVIPVGAEANLLDAQKAAADLHATAVATAIEKGQIILTSGADLVQAQQTGGAIQQGAAAGATTPVSIKSAADLPQAQAQGRNAAAKAAVEAAANPVPIKAKADTASASAAGKTVASTAVSAALGAVSGAINVGRAIAAGVSAGINQGKGGVIGAATSAISGAIAAAKAAAGIKSPSKVFMGIGEDIMDGLVKGIEDGAGAVKSAIENVAQAMIDSTRNVANSLGGALSTLFNDSFTRGAIGGGGNTSTAVAAFNEAAHDVFLQVASNFDTLWQAAGKEAGQRTLEENLLLFFGEKNTSLNAGTVFGRANRAAITGAVDSIKAIGDALLEQGFAAQDTANMLVKYREQLLTTATQAGLSAAEVNALVDSLGLSSAGLADFVNQANRLNQIVAEGQRRANTPTPVPAPLSVGPNPTQQFITNNLYLPTGDPEANALAVVNRLALAVR